MEVKHVEGVGTIITNPDREAVMLMTWRAALRLHAVGMRRSHGKQVTTLAKAHFGLPRGTTIPELQERITARLAELGYGD